MTNFHKHCILTECELCCSSLVVSPILCVFWLQPEQQGPGRKKMLFPEQVVVASSFLVVEVWKYSKEGEYFVIICVVEQR